LENKNNKAELQSTI